MSKIKPIAPAQISSIPTITPEYEIILKITLKDLEIVDSDSDFLLKNDPLRFPSNPTQVKAITPLMRTKIPADSETHEKKAEI